MIYCQQVDLTIHHDWNKTKHMASKILEMENKIPVTETYGSSDHYTLGSMGTISKHNLSKSWYRLASPVVNKTMPWLTEFLEMVKELRPDDGAISYMKGRGGEHIDWPHMQTALNFVFDNTDDGAFTWVKQDEHYETYPSIINTAWILDTQKLHGISNVGHRWALSIHFNTDYEIVKKWFNEHPGLVLGKNNYDS